MANVRVLIVVTLEQIEKRSVVGEFANRPEDERRLSNLAISHSRHGLHAIARVGYQGLNGILDFRRVRRYIQADMARDECPKLLDARAFHLFIFIFQSSEQLHLDFVMVFARKGAEAPDRMESSDPILRFPENF